MADDFKKPSLQFGYMFNGNRALGLAMYDNRYQISIAKQTNDKWDFQNVMRVSMGMEDVHKVYKAVYSMMHIYMDRLGLSMMFTTIMTFAGLPIPDAKNTHLPLSMKECHGVNMIEVALRDRNGKEFGTVKIGVSAVTIAEKTSEVFAIELKAIDKEGTVKKDHFVFSANDQENEDLRYLTSGNEVIAKEKINSLQLVRFLVTLSQIAKSGDYHIAMYNRQSAQITYKGNNGGGNSSWKGGNKGGENKYGSIPEENVF